MKKIIFIVTFFVGKFCLGQEFAIGDKFILTSHIISEHYETQLMQGIPEEKYQTKYIWEIVKCDTSYLMFQNGIDTFWYTNTGLKDAIEKHSIFTLLDFRKYEKKLGKIRMQKIWAGKIWIGMTDDDLLLIKGEYPRDMNNTTTKCCVYSQWVYGNYYPTYYYFKNGVLESYQD